MASNSIFHHLNNYHQDGRSSFAKLPLELYLLTLKPVLTRRQNMPNTMQPSPVLVHRRNHNSSRSQGENHGTNTIHGWNYYTKLLATCHNITAASVAGSSISGGPFRCRTVDRVVHACLRFQWRPRWLRCQIVGTCFGHLLRFEQFPHCSNYKLEFAHIQLVMRRFYHGPEYGIPGGGAAFAEVPTTASILLRGE